MSNNDSTRQLSVSEFIQQALCGLIQKEIRDPRLSQQDKLFLNITHVRVSRDLSVADVQVSFLQLFHNSNNEKGQSATERLETVMHVLKGSAGFLRSRLAKRSTLRTMPALRFHYDDTAEKSARIAQLLAAEKKGTVHEPSF